MTGEVTGDMPGDVYIGLDLGTSSLKGVAVEVGGTIVASARATYPTVREAPGQAEQDPGAWIRAVREVARRLAGEVPAARWRAIGLSAMIPTLVTAGADGEPSGPAVTWEDARAEAQGAVFRDAAAEALGGSAELYRRTGQRVDGRYLLPMAMRVRAAEPERAAATSVLASAKDFLFHWLTGTWATDPSTASGFGCYDLAAGAWLPDLADGTWLADLADGAWLRDLGAAAAARAGDAPRGVPGVPGLPDAPGLPAVMPSTTLRPLAATVARRTALPAGVPVCLGAADSVAAMLALGATQPGDVACVGGTSTVIAGVSAGLVTDPAARCLVTPLAAGDGWGLEMDLVSTGSAVAWLAGVLRLGRGGEAKLLELAAGGSDTPLTFLPFLGRGEQGARWDPDLRGALLGLDISQRPADLARALVDGIVVESCRCLDVLTENGLPTAPVRAAGALAASPFFRRRLADASGRDVLSPEYPERPSSAIGAALIARLALDGPPEDAAAWTGALARTASDPLRRAWWLQRRRRHDDDVTRLAGFFRPSA